LQVKIGPGEEHDINKGYEYLDSLSWRTKKFIADKGYDDDLLRRALKAKGIEAVIPGRRHRKEKIEYDRELYKERYHVENRNCSFKQYRGIASRFDKLAINFLSTIYLNAIVAWAKL
jgi:transposase